MAKILMMAGSTVVVLSLLGFLVLLSRLIHREALARNIA